MKKATNRILSFLTAFAMVIGVLVAPFTSANAAPQAGTPAGPTADTETTAKVTIHKIKVKNLEKLPIEQKDGETVIKGLDNTTEYDGGKISETDLKNFFKDKDAEELAKVTFTYWVFDDKDTYEKMVKTPTEYDTVEKVSKEAKVGKGKEITTTTDGATTEQIKVPANSHKFLWAVEKSKTITDDEGKQQTITGAKAVPFGLALPLFKADGNVNTDIHVYPKNTTADEPKVDKDFEGKANAEQDRNEVTRPEGPIVEGAYVGQEVPYEIETLIPEGAQYKTAAWTDQMTEGLTFDVNMKKKIQVGGEEKEIDAFQVYIGSKEDEETAKPEDYLVKDVDYKLEQDENGFVLEFLPGQPADADKNQEATGLYRINGQAAETRIHITYSAVVNGNAKVERQERNDVIFHYGNEPHHGNTPYPTKPKEGKLKVTKEFDNVYGDFAEGEEVTVTLIDAHTGKPVENLPDDQTATVTLKKGTATDQEHEWHGLDDTKQYKVVEKFKPNDEVKYEKQPDGSVKIIDKKTDNPTPKDPEEPGVVTYGHRFQKIDQSTKEGLPGAEFVVINNIEGDDKGKVLAKKDTATTEIEQEAYVAAEKAYKDAVAELTVKEDGEITYPEGSSAENIADLKAKRDAAYVKVNTEWTWIAKADDKYKGAYVFKSGDNGYFKVTGLNLGNYQLIETKAPDGYAENKTPQDFEVKEGSTGETTKLKSGELEDKVGFLQINNKKVTIPQTGGIGSLIFIVAGLAIMGIAFVAMKKRNAVEA